MVCRYSKKKKDEGLNSELTCVCLPVVSSACPWMWDNLTCWQPARIGEVVEVNCPELFSQFMSEEDYGQ